MPMRFSIFFMLLAMSVSCSEDEVVTYSGKLPVLMTENATDIIRGSATFHASIWVDGTDYTPVRHGFVWSYYNADPKIEGVNSFVNLVNEPLQLEYSSIQPILRRTGNFYVRAFIETDEVVIYGDVKKFGVVR
jgi:hypothetical protein